MYQPVSALDYFRMLVDDAASIPLLEAAASLALDAYPTLDLQSSLAEFDRMARRLGEECRRESTQAGRLKRALRFFYVTQRFAGNAHAYYDPDNSYLHRMLNNLRAIHALQGGADRLEKVLARLRILEAEPVGR
jgi:regulator of sirC expression with transglutaminase-like and TPR domain